MCFYCLNINKFARKYNAIKQETFSVLHNVFWNDIYMPIFDMMITSYSYFIAFFQNTIYEQLKKKLCNYTFLIGLRIIQSL